MKIVHRILSVLFVLLLFLPLIQSATRMLPESRLYGVENSSKGTRFVLRDWWRGKYQSRFEDRLARRIGLRDVLVKTFNEFRFTVFRETYVRAGTHVVIGRDGWLYDYGHVQLFGAPAESSAADRDMQVLEIRRLQDGLARRGIAFCLVLAPTKVTVYPEFAPSKGLRPPEDRKPGEYDLMAPLLEKAGIHVVDAHRLLARLKPTQPYPLFPRTGTHWNYLAAAYVAEAVTTELRRQSGKNWAVIHPVGATTDRRIDGTDNDLGNLLNIWRERSIAGIQTHPVLERVAAGDVAKPDVLCIGDSFVHTLTRILDEQEYYRHRDTFYYFKRRFTFPAGRDEPLDFARFDWTRELLSRDAVVIEINERWLPHFGFGFVQDALKALAADVSTPAERPEAVQDGR